MVYSSNTLCTSHYGPVKRLAYKALEKERWTNTYYGTDLAHDALLELVKQKRRWPDTTSFLAAAFGCIRRVLINRARRKNAKKRRGGQHRSKLDVRFVTVFDRSFSTLEVEEIIQRYKTGYCEVRGTIVEMQWRGYNKQEIMEFLEISSATYERYLRSARKRICLLLLGGEN